MQVIRELFLSILVPRWLRGQQCWYHLELAGHADHAPPLMHCSVIPVLAHSGSIYVMEITFIITDSKLWVSRALASQNPHPLISSPPPPS